MTNHDDLVVYDPRGTVEATPAPLAARPDALDGLRLAVLDNSKWNAGRLLRYVVDALGTEVRFAAITTFKKDSFSRNAGAAEIAAITAGHDLALTAIGD